MPKKDPDEEDYIPLAPKPPKASSGGSGSASSSSSTGSTGSSGSGSTGSSSGGGSGGSDPYSAYLKKQAAKEKKAQKKASDRYIENAQTLQKQAKALKLALGKSGFRRELRIKLGNVRRDAREQDRALLSDYRGRVGVLEDASQDNEKAAAGQTVANLGNRARERANATSEATLVGAGESDLLRAQQMSLRNWQSNQNDVTRSFFDTQSSINASLTDLTTDTRTARIANSQEARGDKEQLWSNYYDQRSETLTQLGNTYGQMAEYYGLANEQVGSKRTRRLQRQNANRSGQAFRRSARAAGQAWKDPGTPDRILDWQGAADFEGALNTGAFSRLTDIPTERPEGATLRKW